GAERVTVMAMMRAAALRCDGSDHSRTAIAARRPRRSSPSACQAAARARWIDNGGRTEASVRRANRVVFKAAKQC
ncbi:hypothetical protein Dimus_035974, partial [Dionaea muscipula]